MIVSKEYDSKNSTLKVSYFNSEGNVSILRKKVHDHEKFNWKRTNTPTSVRDFNGNFLTKQKAPHYLDKFRVEELIIEKLSDQEKELINSYNRPNIYYIDIEVESSNKEFPDPEKAKYPINVMTIVNDNNKAFVLSTQSKLENSQISSMEYEINDYLSNNISSDKPLKIHYYHFDTEKALLEFFFHKAVPKMPLMTGWNFVSFDWLTLVNRANKNKIEPGKYLESAKLMGHNKLPSHAGVIDYMDVFKKFKPYKTVDRYTLDYISNLVLDINKLEYSGSITEFQENVYDFTKYNIIDTILVKLIEDKKNLFRAAFNRVNLTSLQVNKIFSSIALSEMLMFSEFYERGRHLPLLDKNSKNNKDKGTGKKGAAYSGGFVKDPKPGFYKNVAGFDFSSMYPNLTIQFNVSPDSFLGKIGRDLKLEDLEKKYGKENLIITPNNTVFLTSDYNYSASKSILTKYYRKRKTYQKRMQDADHLIHEIEKNDDK